jgi:hypothetical protein
MRARIAIGLAAMALAPAAAADVPPGEANPQATGTAQVLSEPGHVSRWAFVLRKALARQAPDAKSKPVARLRLKTQDGTDELVAALERRLDAHGRAWVLVRLPILPNNTTGWVPEDALGSYHRVRTWLRIDTKHLQAKLIRNGRMVFRSRIGIGKKKWPTPKGTFYVRDRLEGFPPGSIYGALAFGLNARSSVLTDWPGGGFVGIHGTNQPYLLPGRVSHGCIRMRNGDILRLARLMPVGTPVTVY